MNKTITSTKDHMKSLGLSPSKDKHIYAALLDLANVDAPRSLRGYRRDPVSGYKWKREFEFIIKHRYGFSIEELVKTVVGLVDGITDKRKDPIPFVISIGRMLAAVNVEYKTKTILSCIPVNFF